MEVGIERKFEFGEPWRPSEDSLVVLVPMLAKKVVERDYRILEEVQKELSFKDSGRIGKVLTKNSSSEPVFVRAGTILEGVATQSRAVQHSIVVQPNSEKEIPTVCVHASRAISPDSRFKVYSLSAPASIDRALYLRSPQSSVWREVSYFAADSTGKSMDNLPKVLDEVRRSTKEVDELIRRAPCYDSQVGVVIIDHRGVAIMEAFDHPASWKALAEKILRKHSEALARKDESGLLQLRMERVQSAVQDFLTRLLRAQKTLVSENGHRTWTLEEQELAGEATELGGKIIHFVGTRKEGRRERPSVSIREWAPAPERDLRTILGSGREEWIHLNLHSRLAEYPKTWTELRRDWSGSTRTLAKWLKKLESKGEVSKIIRANGKRVYRLEPSA